MNKENFKRLADHVRGLKKPIQSWSTRECIEGMIAYGIMSDNERVMADRGSILIHNFLGCSVDTAADLFYMDSSTYVGHSTSRLGFYGDFFHWNVEAQKVVLLDVLSRLEDTGEVLWPWDAPESGA